MPTAAHPDVYLENLRRFAGQIHPTLDSRDYYQLLNVPRSAETAAIRAAYYKLADQLHPDRFQTLGDSGLRNQLETIYARISEAYRVLSHPQRRVAYDRALAAGQKRMDLQQRETNAPKNPEDAIKHPEAKKFFRMGMVCMGRKDWKGAVMNFTFAKNFEPGTAILAQKLGEAMAAQKTSPPT